MAIRFDASGDYLGRTANLPASNALTLMGWFKIITDRNDFSTFFAIGVIGGWGSNGLLQTDENGTQLDLFHADTHNLGTDLVIGTWYHLALMSNGTRLQAYVNGLLDIDIAWSAWTDVFDYMQVGNDPGSEWLNGCAVYLKVYGAGLTIGEIQQEMNVIRPVRTDSLLIWSPGFPGSGERARDYSGNGYNWTEAGTLTDEDPPPVSWGAGAFLFPIVIAAVAGGQPTNIRTFGVPTGRRSDRPRGWN